jgi:hypothetical protein
LLSLMDSTLSVPPNCPKYTCHANATA